jgi:ribonuclease R
MSEHLHQKILQHLKSEQYQPLKPRRLARDLDLHQEQYGAFRDALRELMREGRVVQGSRGAVVLPTQRTARDEIIGTYRHNRRGFGFLVPTDPTSHEDLFIPPGENAGAMTGDIVRARITSRGHRDGRALFTGRVTEIIERKHTRFVGTLAKYGGEWLVLPDGNTLTEPILTPDAASRHIKPATKVVVELTSFPEEGQRAQGVITEILGQTGEKDVDLKSVIVQFNLPGDFPDQAKDQARQTVHSFDPEEEIADRLDLSSQLTCTIDPDDAKDYDDAISLARAEGGRWELGVHIADVAHFIPADSPLDLEARDRGNSSYFPGHVIPMLPEILSNGICSLQESVPRLVKSVFITFGDDGRPLGSRFANSIIRSAKRLRYREAQAIIDKSKEIPHPEGNRRLSDYPKPLVDLLHQMNALAKRIQKRRRADGQLNLDLPSLDLVLDEEGKVIDAVPEDQSFTHTIIEMFMVEANEAIARLLDGLDVPFLRRIHPGPEAADSERLRHFVQVAGYKLPKTMDRKAIQSLLDQVRGKPESFAINLAILKSLSRAEYSPDTIGHYALASEHYCHFTSPIRRYADLTIHRLLAAYLEAQKTSGKKKRSDVRDAVLEDAPEHGDLLEVGKHISFTERRSEDAERELRQVKVLELLEKHIGDEFDGVVTGITGFGIFIQLRRYLIDGLIRYEDLLDDWWDVDEKTGMICGQRTGRKLRIGDSVKAIVVRVDLPRRELDLAITQLPGQPREEADKTPADRPKSAKSQKPQKKHGDKLAAVVRGGGSRRGGSSSRGGPRRRGR